MQITTAGARVYVPTRRTPFMALAAGLLVTACAQLPAPDVVTSAPTNPEPQSVTRPVSPAYTPPNVALSPEILYQLTLSEIAAQRGRVGPAYATLYELALKTRDARIARRAVELALSARQPTNALQAGRLWSELMPESIEARETLVNILVLTDQYAEAETLFSAELAASTNLAQSFVRLNAILARSPQRPRALAMMEKLAAPFSNLPEAHLAVAQMAQLNGNRTRAIEKIHDALKLRPDWERAGLLGGQILQAESPRAAADFLMAFLQKAPRAYAARLALGRTLANDQHYDAAAQQLQLLLAAQPENLDAINLLGAVSYQAKKIDDAEKYFQRYLSVAATSKRGESNVNQVYLQLAQIAEDRNNVDAALGLLNNVKSGNEFIAARAKRAMLLTRQGKLDEARKELQDAWVDSGSERAQLIQIEAQLLRDANRFQDAFEVLSKGISSQPDQPELLYDHAMVADKINRVDLMESSLRAVIRLRPDGAQAYNALGYSLADRNLRLPEALVLIERALTLSPDDAAIIDSMGWVQYRLGNTSKAIEFLRRAYQMRPDAEVATHLGEVLWVSGQHAEAQKLWQEARQKEPDSEVLRDTLARFNAQLTAR